MGGGRGGGRVSRGNEEKGCGENCLSLKGIILAPSMSPSSEMLRDTIKVLSSCLACLPISHSVGHGDEKIISLYLFSFSWTLTMESHIPDVARRRPSSKET